MAQNTVQQVLPGTESWFAFFGTCYTIFMAILPSFSLVTLTTFFFNLNWLDNVFLKLIFFLLLCYSCLGFWVFGLKLNEYWEEAFIPYQRGKYMSKLPQKAITLRVKIPDNYKYNVNNLVGFFFFMGNSFKTTNATKQAQYNYGRWFSNITFDYIIHRGDIKTYCTFPRKKYNEVIEMFKRFFPEVSLEVTEDPFKEYPKTWSEGTTVDGYDDFVGFNIGNGQSNMYPTEWGDSLNPENMPMDMMMRALRDTHPESKIFIQNIFRFNPGNAIGGKPEIQAEFQKWRQDLLETYAPMNNGKLDSHAFETLLPHDITGSINRIDTHIKFAYPVYTYRVMALCDHEQSEKVINTMEKLVRIHGGSTEELAGGNITIKFVTSTHQEYKNVKSDHPLYQLIYDTFVFPTWFGDQAEAIIAPWYEKFYYINENRFRRYINYKTMIKRDLNAPWNGDWNVTVAFSMAGFFQFPMQSKAPKITVGDIDLDAQKEIYNYDKP